jgi:hypothetical protein
LARLMMIAAATEQLPSAPARRRYRPSPKAAR